MDVDCRGPWLLAPSVDQIKKQLMKDFCLYFPNRSEYADVIILGVALHQDPYTDPGIVFPLVNSTLYYELNCCVIENHAVTWPERLQLKMSEKNPNIR